MGRVQGPPSTPSMDKGSLSRAPGWTTSFDTDIDIDAGPSFRLKAGVRWRVGSLTFSHSSLRRKLKWKLKSEVHCNTAWRLVEGSPSKSSSTGDSRLLHSCFISSKHLVIESYNIISETYLKHVAAIRLSKETFRDIGTSRAWKGQRLPWDDPPRWTDQETPRHRPSLSSGSLDVGPWTFELRMARNNWRDVNLAASTLILKHSHYDHIMITLWSLCVTLDTEIRNGTFRLQVLFQDPQVWDMPTYTVYTNLGPPPAECPPSGETLRHPCQHKLCSAARAPNLKRRRNMDKWQNVRAQKLILSWTWNMMKRGVS